MFIIFGFKMIKLMDDVCVCQRLPEETKRSPPFWRFQIPDLVKILVPVSLFSCQLRPEVQSCLLALHYFCLLIIILSFLRLIIITFSFLCLIIITFSLPNKHFIVLF